MGKVIQHKQVVEKHLSASSRAKLVEQFTQWINEWPYDHYINLWVYAIIGDVPYAVPDELGHHGATGKKADRVRRLYAAKYGNNQ